MKILFMGTPDFAIPTLDALLASSHEIIGVVTQLDAPAGRGRILRPPPVKRRAIEAALPVHQPEKPKRELWPDLWPDLIVVIAYGQILRSDILEWPARGCINLHASLLPRYRGAAPINWTIIEGETETGVTSMLMAERLDAGDILLQRGCPIAEDDTAETLWARLADLSAEVCLETLEALGQGTLTPRPQEESKATYARKLKREDAYLDWGLAAAAICRRVRGLRPWPVARTRWGMMEDRDPTEKGEGEDWIRVWMAVPGSEEGPPGVLPGTVGGLGKNALGQEGVRIAAADGWVLLTEVQPEGGRRMDARAFWQGHRLPADAVLG
ncbi:MAG: methionyl-tRNA formyltransferase [Nitrospinota bacterium]